MQARVQWPPSCEWSLWPGGPLGTGASRITKGQSMTHSRRAKIARFPRSGLRIRLPAAAVAVAFSLLFHAEQIQAQPQAGQWVVGADAVVDLWYHGLAISGIQTGAGMPLYDVGYRGRFVAARAAAGADATPMEAAAPEILGRLRLDPAFEVLHFVPLYFPGVGTDQLIDALRQVASSDDPIPVVRDPMVRFGATAVAGILTTPDQRRALGRYLDLLDAERGSFYAEFARTLHGQFQARAAALQTRWNGEMAVALWPYLTRYSLERGRLTVSPTLGLDGRILEGDRSNPWDNQMVVGWNPDLVEGADGALFADLVSRSARELCFPAVRRAMDSAGIDPATPSAGAEISGRAATRCGDLLLDQYLPAYGPAYRRWATGAGASSPSADPAVFAAAFPLEPGLEQALLEAVGR